MIESLTLDLVTTALNRHWGIAPEAVSAWKSPRIFRLDGYGLARVGFPRDGLTSAQLVELVDTLHAQGCPVPGILPTSAGALSVPLAQMTLAVEQELPGQECSSADLDMLPKVGRVLGTLHSAMYEFNAMPGQVSALGDWVDLTLTKAETWAAEHLHAPYVQTLRAKIPDALRNLRVRFGLVHGDLRAPNVLRHQASLGFIDFNCKYDPQLSDIAKIRNKWLMNGDPGNERPLTVPEIADVLRGYHQTRPLSPEEIKSFPLVWAVDQAWRLAQDLKVTSRFAADRASHWPIHEQMTDLPNAIETGREILRLALPGR